MCLIRKQCLNIYESISQKFEWRHNCTFTNKCIIRCFVIEINKQQTIHEGGSGKWSEPTPWNIMHCDEIMQTCRYCHGNIATMWCWTAVTIKRYHSSPPLYSPLYVHTQPHTHSHTERCIKWAPRNKMKPMRKCSIAPAEASLLLEQSQRGLPLFCFLYQHSTLFDPLDELVFIYHIN